MIFFRPLTPLAAAAVVTTGLAFAAPAQAVPAQFTSKGEAVSYTNGQATRVPNTLYFKGGNIRLEMAAPVSADGQSAFSVVLAKEGQGSITLLNTAEKQAMKLDASSLEAVTENPSLQKISSFKLTEFARVFRAQSKKIGAEQVAGQACTILEQKEKNGTFRLWLSDKYEVPLRFAYYQGGKPAFTYNVKQFSLDVKLPASAFTVPKDFQLTDISAMMNGMEAPSH